MECGSRPQASVPLTLPTQAPPGVGASKFAGRMMIFESLFLSYPLFLVVKCLLFTKFPRGEDWAIRGRGGCGFQC